MNDINRPTATPNSHNMLRDQAGADQKLNRFAIIAAYSLAVLLALGYIPGVDVVLGLGL